MMTKHDDDGDDEISVFEQDIYTIVEKHVELYRRKLYEKASEFLYDAVNDYEDEEDDEG